MNYVYVKVRCGLIDRSKEKGRPKEKGQSKEKGLSIEHNKNRVASQHANNTCN